MNHDFKLRCDWCNFEHREFYPDQAHGCSSNYECETNTISCGYGSRYEGEEYSVEKCLEGWIPHSANICDTCISTFINEGSIVPVKQDAFGLGNSLSDFEIADALIDEAHWSLGDAASEPEKELKKEFNRDLKLIEKKFVWQQENDCCDDGKHDYESGFQTLTAETHDGGGGAYLVIKTERWALDRDELERFIDLLQTVLDGVSSDD